MAANLTTALPSQKWTESFWLSQPSKVLMGHCSTTNLPLQADVVIVGSGISGVGAAWHLLQGSNMATSKTRPLSVVMLEAREACWGATGRNGGHCQPIVYQHPSDASIGHFEIKNLHAIESLVKELRIDCEFFTQPAVRGLYSEADLEVARKSIMILQETDPMLAAHTHFTTDPAELQKLRVPTALGAIETDVAARMWPYKFVAHLLEQLLHSSTNGLNGSFNLQTSTPVVSLSLADESDDVAPGTNMWKVLTPRGEIVTPQVILATNGHTAALLPEYEELIVPCRGQMTALIPPPDASKAHRITKSYVFAGAEFYDYLVQRPTELGEHLMFGGGCMDEDNLGLTDDSVVDSHGAKHLRQHLYPLLRLDSNSTHLPELKATHEWTGIMGYSRDYKPWVGPVPSKPGIFMAAGYTGQGMPNAFLCGHALAVMLRASLEGLTQEAAVQAAINDPCINLPPAYVISQERIESAQRLPPFQRVKISEEHSVDYVERPNSCRL